MSAPQTIAAAMVAWTVIVLAIRWIVLPLLSRGPGGDPVQCLLWIGCRLYAAVVHRAQYVGHEKLRRSIDPGPLIVVSNHTSSVDPLLIQTGCWFRIRWLMAAEMMIPELDWVWRQQRIIPVSRTGGDSRPVRESIRHVKGGGVIGIFPEGRIVVHGEIRPFLSGVGAMVLHTGAPVLLVWISGTPQVGDLRKAFATPSHARVEFVDLMRFDGIRDADAITQAIRQRLSEASGWPLNDEAEPLEHAERRRQSAQVSPHVMQPDEV